MNKGINKGINKRQIELLNKLVDDTCSQLPVNERGIHMVTIEALIWNLFKGGYQFNVTDVKYIIESKLKSQNFGL